MLSMKLLDVELVNESLDIESFNYLCDQDYPYVMLGFQLKNLYDQKRIQINKKFESQDFIHFVPQELMMPKFFRGIKINIQKKYISLINELASKANYSLENYKLLLEQYNLSCDNCYAYFNKGIYPIDSEHINDISTFKGSATSILSTEEIAHFQAISYPVIYILNNKNISNTTTKNFYHTIVEKYRNN